MRKKRKFPSAAELEEARNFLNKTEASRPLAKEAGPVERVKYALCEKFVIYLNQYKLTQRALAQQLSLDEGVMSKILHYNIEDFTVDRLIRYLIVLYPDTQIDINTGEVA